MTTKDIFPASRNTPEKEPFFHNLPQEIINFVSNYLLEQPPIKSFIIPNAFASSYGVVMEKWKLIPESFSVYQSRKKDRIYSFFSFLKARILGRVIHTKANCLLVNHCWHDNYYHWMIELLPRLFLWEKKAPLLTLVIHKKKFKYQRETLAYFNFRDIIELDDGEILRCPQVEFSSFPNFSYLGRIQSKGKNYSAIILRLNHRLLAEMVNKIIQNIPNRINPAPENKIYISRKKAPKRKIVNEIDLEALLHSEGFSTIIMEDLNFEQQVQLIQSASILIACHGAGLANCIFMKPNTVVIDLVPGNLPEFCFWNLAHARQLHYAHVHCKTVGVEKNPAFNDIEVDMLQIKSLLSIVKSKPPET